MSVETLKSSGPNLAPHYAPTVPAAIVIDVSDDQHARMRDLASFKFRHRLGEHPSMTLDGIGELAQRMLDEKRFDQILCRKGAVEAADDYCDVKGGPEILETLASLNTSDAWLRLTRVDAVTTQFRDVLEQFYSDLSELYGRDVRSRVMKTFVTLFVSSPHAITPYHMDHTWNFLLQIRGHKSVHLYDPNDPQVLLPNDKEAWYMQKSGITRKDGVTGIAYDLAPGDGVHHPVNAPHWVRNGADVSISLSLGLCLREANRDAKVHQVNYLLRRLGVEPVPPGRSKWRDAAKASFILALSDRNPSSFDEVLFSGISRLSRISKALRPKRAPRSVSAGE